MTVAIDYLSASGFIVVLSKRSLPRVVEVERDERWDVYSFSRSFFPRKILLRRVLVLKKKEERAMLLVGGGGWKVECYRDCRLLTFPP